MNNFKAKFCEICGVEYKPTAPASRYCYVCGPVQAKKVNREATDRCRARKGVRVGIGSGYGNGRGKDHPAYKNGIKTFYDFSETARQTVRYCERCGKDLLNAGIGCWALHHRDHNRDNNVRDNFELLCKRCHQIEHNCIQALLKVQRPSRKGVGNSVPEAPDTLKAA
jgi:hypothetical protein